MNKTMMLASGVGKSCQEEKSLSLLQDDDDQNPSPTKQNSINPDIERDNNSLTCSLSGNNHDSIVEQATKWINEMEQLRDSIVWHQVENSFHMDRLCMIATIHANDNTIETTTRTH
jgi:hypothetical protein